MRLLIAAFCAFLLSGIYAPPLAGDVLPTGLGVYRDILLKILFIVIAFEALLALRQAMATSNHIRVVLAVVLASLLLVATATGAAGLLGWSLAEAQAYRWIGLTLLSLWALVESILAFRKRGDAIPKPVAVPAEKPFKPAVKEELPPYGEVVVLLSLLQEKGRLLDFLTEDITKFNDGQVAAASRVVHQGCASVLREYFNIVPTHDGKEGQAVSIDKAADPSHYRLVGKVVGEAPFNGKLVHRGWKTTKITLPRSAKAIDPTAGNVITPAEVEVK